MATNCAAVPVQQAVVPLVGAGVGWAGITVVAAPVVVALAASSWFLVERPALHWKPGRGGVVRVGTA